MKIPPFDSVRQTLWRFMSFEWSSDIIFQQDACSGVHTDLKMTTYVLCLWCNRQGIQIANRKRKAWPDRYMSGWDMQNYPPELSRGDVFIMSNETQELLANTNVIHKCTWSLSIVYIRKSVT